MTSKETHKEPKPTVFTTEAAPKMPRLDDLVTESWSTFVGEFDHYLSLGGTKAWTELVDSTVLDIIKDLAEVTDFKSASNRRKARVAVDKIFGASTTLNLYDSLRQVRMTSELKMDALMAYTKDFKAIRNRVPKLGETKQIGELYTRGLFTGRLKQCVQARITDTSELGTIIGVAISELKKLIEAELTHKALMYEKRYRMDFKAKDEVTGKKCHVCGKVGHLAKDCWNAKGKRRFAGTQSNLTGSSEKRGAQWIVSTDPRYNRFYPTIICRKCGKKGHFEKFCKEKEVIKSKDKSCYYEILKIGTGKDFTVEMKIFRDGKDKGTIME
ncbi:hypothetical protein ADUPG1_006352, partial [Aduncisulcus paluster]